MTATRIFKLLVILAAACAPIAASQTGNRCPSIWIKGPTADVESGEPIAFAARLSVTRSTSVFRWEVSAGTIVSGQGTPSIIVDTEGLGGITLTARVNVDGMPAGCPTEASRSSNVLPEGIACGLPFDTYGDINFEDEEARLDNFAIQLTNQETATGYIFFYAGRRSYQGEADERLRRAKDYLVNKRNIDSKQVVLVDGGYREDLTVILIIAPVGANPPVAMPTLSPAEVEFTKPRRAPSH